MTKDTILIIDEGSFSRVCSAILSAEGYTTSELRPVGEKQPPDVGLVIASYPYGSFFFDRIKQNRLPVIVLTDHISTDLIDHLEQFPNSYCMIKPIDYSHFKKVVGQYMSGDWSLQGGYSIV